MSHEVQIIPDRSGHDIPPIYDARETVAQQPPSPLEIIRMLLKERVKWAVILCVIGGVLGGVAGFFLAKEPEYESEGMIQIKPFVPGVFNEASPLPMFDAYIESQVAIMQSRRTIDMAMQSAEWQALGRGLTDKSVADFQS